MLLHVCVINSIFHFNLYTRFVYNATAQPKKKSKYQCEIVKAAALIPRRLLVKCDCAEYEYNVSLTGRKRSIY